MRMENDELMKQASPLSSSMVFLFMDSHYEDIMPWSWYGNALPITGPFWEESTCDCYIPNVQFIQGVY